MAEQTLESIRNEMRIFLDIFSEFDDLAKEQLASKGDGEQDRKERIALFGIYMISIKKR